MHGSQALEEVLANLQSLVETARRGDAAEAPVGAVAKEQGGLVASQQLGANGLAARPREDDLPAQPMAAPAEEPWQDVLRRAPQAAAGNEQVTLGQIFARQAGKGAGRGHAQELPRTSPY